MTMCAPNHHTSGPRSGHRSPVEERVPKPATRNGAFVSPIPRDEQEIDDRGQHLADLEGAEGEFLLVALGHHIAHKGHDQTTDHGRDDLAESPAKHRRVELVKDL